MKKLIKTWSGSVILDIEKQTLEVSGKDKVLSFKEMDKICQEYKGCNVIHKPAPILIYQQFIKKTGKYGFVAENID